MIELIPLGTYSLVMSATPGPNNVLLAVSGANFGYRRSLPHILGIGLGSSTQTYLVCLGLGAVFQAYPGLHTALKIIGTVYMLYLAWQLFDTSIKESNAARPVSFWEAAAFQFVNPKIWVKSVTIATVFMPTGTAPWLGGMYVFAITLLINFPSVSMWALFGAGIRQFLTNERRRLAFNGVMAALLVGTAAFMVYR